MRIITDTIEYFKHKAHFERSSADRQMFRWLFIPILPVLFVAGLCGCGRTTVTLHETGSQQMIDTTAGIRSDTGAESSSANDPRLNGADGGSNEASEDPNVKDEGFESGFSKSDTGRRASGAAEEKREPETTGLIVVHVCGAVRNPGVYCLASGARAAEAVNAAGGMNEQADQSWVNLAQPLTDGQQLRIPTAEETGDWLTASPGDTGMLQAGEAAQQDSRVNINTADEKALQTLPGIGEARAAAIIAYRNEHGPFEEIGQIQLVSGIKGSVFEKIRDRICVR